MADVKFARAFFLVAESRRISTDEEVNVWPTRARPQLVVPAIWSVEPLILNVSPELIVVLGSVP